MALELPPRPLIVQAPDAPNRRNQNRYEFAEKANYFVSWMYTHLKPNLDDTMDWIEAVLGSQRSPGFWIGSEFLEGIEDTYDAGTAGSEITIDPVNGEFQKVTLVEETTISIITPEHPTNIHLELIGAHPVIWSVDNLTWREDEIATGGTTVLLEYSYTFTTDFLHWSDLDGLFGNIRYFVNQAEVYDLGDISGTVIINPSDGLRQIGNMVGETSIMVENPTQPTIMQLHLLGTESILWDSSIEWLANSPPEGEAIVGLRYYGGTHFGYLGSASRALTLSPDAGSYQYVDLVGDVSINLPLLAENDSFEIQINGAFNVIWPFENFVWSGGAPPEGNRYLLSFSSGTWTGSAAPWDVTPGTWSAWCVDWNTILASGSGGEGGGECSELVFYDHGDVGATISIDPSFGNNQIFNLTEDVTVSIVDPEEPVLLEIHLLGDDFQITWPESFDWWYFPPSYSPVVLFLRYYRGVWKVRPLSISTTVTGTTPSSPQIQVLDDTYGGAVTWYSYFWQNYEDFYSRLLERVGATSSAGTNVQDFTVVASSKETIYVTEDGQQASPPTGGEAYVTIDRVVWAEYEDSNNPGYRIKIDYSGLWS